MTRSAGPPHRPDRRDGLTADPAARSFLIITTTAATAGFAIAFDLGAHGVVFFERLHVIWTLSTAALLGSFLLGDRWTPPLWGRAVLAIPSLWLLVAFVETGRPDAIVASLSTVVTMITVLSLPYLVYALVTVVSPGFLELPTRRLQLGAVLVAVTLGLVGFGLGLVNDRYLTCGDFVVSGNDRPANCRPGDATTRVFEP